MFSCGLVWESQGKQYLLPMRHHHIEMFSSVLNFCDGNYGSPMGFRLLTMPVGFYMLAGGRGQHDKNDMWSRALLSTWSYMTSQWNLEFVHRRKQHWWQERLLINMEFSSEIPNGYGITGTLKFKISIFVVSKIIYSGPCYQHTSLCCKQACKTRDRVTYGAENFA